MIFMITCYSPSSMSGILVCMNAFGKYAIITVRSSFASTIAVRIILSNTAVGLAESSLDKNYRVSFPL